MMKGPYRPKRCTMYRAHVLSAICGVKMRCGAMNRSNDRLDDGNLAGQLFDLEGLELRGTEKKALKEGQWR